MQQRLTHLSSKGLQWSPSSAGARKGQPSARKDGVMIDESTFVGKCANSVKPSKAGGSEAMAVSSVSRHAADALPRMQEADDKTW